MMISRCLLVIYFLYTGLCSENNLHSDNQQTIDDEIASLDELIRLQQMKLNLLKSKKQSSGNSDSNGHPHPTRPQQEKFHPNPPRREVPHVSTGAPEKTDGHSSGKFEDYLIPRYRFKMNYTLASYHILTCTAQSNEKSQQSKPISLVVTIDTSGVAHIINPHTNGEELISVDLLPFHNGSPILVSDVEGESEDGPILVTGSADGDLHVLGIQVTYDYITSAIPSLLVNVGSLYSFSMKETNPSSLVVPTALHLYYRGHQRGLGIYLGDSFCRFSSYSINGTLSGRVSASAERDSFTTIEKLSVENRKDPHDVSYCGPREHDGVGKMSRIGQVIAAPIGHSVIVMHISRLNVIPRICTGGSERIIQAVIDLKSMSYVIAKTVTGSLLTFNTKAQTGRNSEIYCELVRVQPPVVIQPETPIDAGAQIPNTLVSLRGAMIGSSGCSLSVINTTEIKRSRFGSNVVAIHNIHENCIENVPTSVPGNALVPFYTSVSPLWIDITPRYQRDFFARTSAETMISVAYNIHSNSNERCDVPDAEDDIFQSEIIMFLSLITPVEEPDELAWIKWPMLAFGVGAFLLYKIFFPGTKFQKKSPRLGKQVGSPFRGQAGRFSPEDVTAELRKELDNLDTMASRLGRGAPSSRDNSTSNRYNGTKGRYDD